MANIVSVIQTVVEALTSPAPTFVHGEKSFANLTIDDISGEIVVLYEPIKSSDTIQSSGILQEVYQITMAFLDKSEIDYTPTQRSTIIEAERETRRYFLNDIIAVDNFVSIGTVTTTNIPFEMDNVLTGVLIEFSITFNNLDSIC